MPTPSTTASRGAALTTAALGAWLASRLLLGAGDSYVRVIVVLLTVLSLLAAAKLWRDNCFESRLVAVLVALASLTGSALGSTVGLPGSHGGQVSVAGVVGLVLGSIVPVLLLLDAKIRASGLNATSPYA